MTLRTPAFLVAVLGVVGATLIAAPTAGARQHLAPTSGSSARRYVLPAHARPDGYSLRDMAKRVAQFTTSGNDPAAYPETPFQILYTATFDAQPEDGGVIVTGENTFMVDSRTAFYVPLQNATDSEPVVGNWPADHRAAVHYFFARAQLGGHHYRVTVDGSDATLGSAYLAGPVRVAHLADGTGHHIITLGAFIEPLPVGEHTVRITGRLAGQLLHRSPFELAFYAIDFTYHVTVNR